MILWIDIKFSVLSVDKSLDIIRIFFGWTFDMKHALFTFFLLLILHSSLSFALENDDPSSDILLDDLLQELEEVTEIATHTKLNVDFVPGMVTVLHGIDLQRQGIFTLLEAMETVPGVEITSNNEGQSSYVMRGIGKSFSSGKIKMLVNGRAMNAAMSAASTISTIPIQMVERIEIIRGPGSAIYGEYAYAGVVNVILRKDTHVFYSGSTHNKHIIGGNWSNYQTDSEVKYSLALSASDNKGKQVKSGPDYLKDLNTGLPSDTLFNNISNSPGYVNEAERIFISGLQVSYKNIQWDTVFNYQHVGDSYGFQNALPPKVEPVRKVISITSDIDKKITLNRNMSGKITAGGRYYALRGKAHHFLPVGFPDLTSLNQTTGQIENDFEDGVLGSPNYTEYEIHGGVEINYSALINHDLLFGFHGTYIKQGDTWAKRNQEFVSGFIAEVPFVEYRGDENWLTENNTRKIASIYAQDQWKVIKPLTMTIGGRYDNYFDSGSSFNPRLAAVYNFLDNHIFKIQYARAFRPPTFLEMYIQNNIVAEGNVDIKPERIQSIDAGYIFNKPGTNTHVRITTFYSQLDDLITNDDTTGKYENLGSVISKGLEFEFKQKLFNSITFDMNGTILRVTDKASGDSLPKVANIYGYASLSHQPLKNIMLTINNQYIGSRKREENDSRSKMSGYQVVDAAINVDHVYVKEASVSFGIKNVFDKTVLHPSPLVSFSGAIVPSYAGDYPRPGREFWLNIAYKY